MESYFEEFIADAESSEVKLGKLAEIYVHRIYEDAEMKNFSWGVSVTLFEGNELTKAQTLARFASHKLARQYAEKLKDFYRSQGYESSLKGEFED